MVMTPMSKPFFWYFNHARGGYGYPEYLYINLIQKKSKKHMYYYTTSNFLTHMVLHVRSCGMEELKLAYKPDKNIL